MASWFSETLYCRAQNRAERKVHGLSEFHAAGFWSQAYGNFYIGGGTRERRRTMLVSKLVFAAMHDPLPTVILTGSEELAQELIAIQSQQHLFSSLTVSGCGGNVDTGANYQPLYGMSPASLGNFLARAAASLGENADKALHSFGQAVGEIAEAIYPGQASLQVVDWLLKQDIEAVSQLAERYSVNTNALYYFKQNTEAHSELNNVVKNLYERLSTLTSRDCATRLNAVSRVRQDPTGVTLIRSTSTYQELANAMFAEELRQLAGHKYRLILFEAPVDRDDEIYRYVEEALVKNAHDIGLCYENPMLFLGQNGVSGFGSHVFLGHSSIDYHGQEDILRFEGEYTKQVVERVFAPMGRGRGRRSLLPDYTHKPQRELRITPDDMAHADAMLKDNNNRLLVVRRLRF